VIAVDQVHRDASIEQRTGQFVEWPVALDIAQEYGRCRRRCESGKASVDVMPVLVNVANENDGHAVPVWPGKRYHGDMVTVRKPPLVWMTLTGVARDPSERPWRLPDREAVQLKAIYRTSVPVMP
jgi:hypothetical protein